MLLCASAHAQVQVPVLLHMAQENEADVAPAEFIETELEHANTIYRPLGIELVLAGTRSFVEARLVTREDRDALGAHLRRGVINWFVVAQLMDVDEPGRERRGVHWHVRASPARRFVIVSAISGPYVLAHELGHFFGNPQHSDVAGNLMCYTQTDQVPVLDDAQQANVARTLRSMRTRGELLALQKARKNLGSSP
ncbi:MAG TPA: hypothetical protein VFX59_09315 [Polyangiales bacterium]|nr:hypothetical protein [Polyangiales bacterium]